MKKSASTVTSLVSKRRVRKYESRRGGMSAGCMGCLVVAIVLLALVLGGGIYAWMNWKNWAGDLAIAGVTQFVDASELTDEQKTALKGEFTSIVERFKSGEITLDQLAAAAKKLEDSPIVPAGLALAANAKYIAPSSLTEEEKSDARIQISRFVHGVIEEKIPKDKIDAAVAPIALQTQPGQWQFKDQSLVKTEELKTLVANMRKEADDAGVAEQPPEVDLAAEIRKIMDEVLTGAASTSPAPSGG